LIAFIVLLESIDVIISLHAFQRLLITNWGNPSILRARLNESNISVLITILLIMTVQLFFANQIQRFNERVWPLTYFMVLCSVTAAALSSSVYVKTIIVGNDSSDERLPWKLFATLPNIMQAAVDLASSISLTFLLNGTQGGYKIRRIQHVVKWIVLFTMTRGIILMTVQLAYTVTLFAARSSYIWNFFLSVQAKFYTNNLLAMPVYTSSPYLLTDTQMNYRLNYRENMKTRDGIMAASLSVSGEVSNAHRGSMGEHHFVGVYTIPGAESSVVESSSVQNSEHDQRTHDSRHEEPRALEQFI